MNTLQEKIQGGEQRMIWMIVTKLFFGLASLILVVRLLGKKSLSEITPFDLVYTLVLGGILEESVYDDKVRFWQVMFAIALWGLFIYLIEKIVQKNEKINRWVKGEPSVLIMNGKMNLGKIQSNKLEMEQLRAMLRKQNCMSVKNAKYVVLEAAGAVTVALKSSDDTSLSFLIIEEGHIKERAINGFNRDREWVLEEVKKQGYSSLKEIVYGEWSK